MRQKHTWLGHYSLENIHNEFLQWIDQRLPCKNSGCNIRLTAGRGEIQWVEDQIAQWRNTPVLNTLLWSLVQWAIIRNAPSFITFLTHSLSTVLTLLGTTWTLQNTRQKKKCPIPKNSVAFWSRLKGGVYK